MVLSDLDSDDSDGAHIVISATNSQALPPPLSNPNASHKLTSGKYDSLDDLLNDLYNHAAKAGFAVYKIRSNNYVKGFGATRVNLGYLKGKIRPLFLSILVARAKPYR